jgi:hypothetical protein
MVHVTALFGPETVDHVETRVQIGAARFHHSNLCSTYAYHEEDIAQSWLPIFSFRLSATGRERDLQQLDK